MNLRAVTTAVLLGSVPIALLIALWQVISSFGYAPPALLPPPGLVFLRLVHQLATTTFKQEIAATLFRLFAGFSIDARIRATTAAPDIPPPWVEAPIHERWGAPPH